MTITPTPGLRVGANAELRIGYESVLLLRRDGC